MNKYVLIYFLLVLFITGCEQNPVDDAILKIRRAAWNSLTETDKSTVIINWTTAPVTETTYNSKSASVVVFNTSNMALLGPITVYVEATTNVVLGQALRD